MKTILLSLAFAAISAAQKPPAGVPADAKAVDETSWRAVDAKGKAWLYKKTPFGMMKSPELTSDEQKKRDGVGDPVEGMTVKEEGDMLKFNRPGPFGMYTWTKKRTDLTDDEKLVWERSKAVKSAAKE